MSTAIGVVLLVLGFGWSAALVRLVLPTFRDRRPAPPPTVLERLMRDRLVVTMKTSDTFSGILWEVDEKLIVLRSSWAVTPEGVSDIMIDGELVLLLADIAYTQKP